MDHNGELSMCFIKYFYCDIAFFKHKTPRHIKTHT